MTDQLLHTLSRLGQDITGYVALPSSHHTIWPETDNSTVYKFSMHTQHSLQHCLMLETEIVTVSKMSNTNSMLRQLAS
jgi:hypothetical protein